MKTYIKPTMQVLSVNGSALLTTSPDPEVTIGGGTTNGDDGFVFEARDEWDSSEDDEW